MAKPIKLTKDRQGESFYPATTTDAVVHPEQRKTLTEIISETVPTTITNGTGTNSSLQVNAINCKATGVNSFAGGINAEANGDYSMAYGRFAQANGRGSIALGGLFLETNNEGEAAFGQKNKSNTGSTSALQTLFSVGNGDITEIDNNDLKTVGNGTNALEIMRNGDVWIGNYNEGKKLWDVATETSPLILENVHPDTIFFDITNITPIEYDGEETFSDEYTVSYISLSDFEANTGLSWSETKNKKMIQYTDAVQSILYNIIGYGDNLIVSECYSYLEESRTLGFALLNNEVVAVLQKNIQLLSTKDIIEETQLSEKVQNKLNNIISIYLAESETFLFPEIGDAIQHFPTFGLGRLKNYLDSDFKDANILGKLIITRIGKFNGDAFSVSVPQAYKSGDTYYFIIIVYGETNIKYTCSFTSDNTAQVSITSSAL